MKKQVFLLLVLLPLMVTAQKKELLLIIKESEEFDIDNSKINPTATGATWEITTINRETNQYFLYTNTIKGKPIPVDVRQDNFITFGREDGKEFFRINATGVKYGPYEGLKVSVR